MKKIAALTTSFTLAFGLTACGGGSDDGGGTVTTPTTPTKTIEQEFSSYLTDLTKNHIIPSYQNFEMKSKKFNQATVSFCALTNATSSDLDILKSQWSAAHQAWQHIQWVKVGPVVDMLFRIQFWPDKNNAVTIAIKNHLLEQQPLTAQYIASKSVGGQGFPAAEQLLYPTDTQYGLLAADNKSKRCELLTAISANLADISTDLTNQWQASGGNYGNTLITGTGEFTGVQDAVEELVTNWLEQLEKVKDEKILKPLDKASPGLPLSTESHHSDTSIANIKTNIAVFNDIYTAGNGHGFGKVLGEFLKQQSINDNMKTKITAAINAINKLDGSYTQALSDNQKRQQLTIVITNLRALRDLFTADFVQALDLNIGFNSNDGD
ncbi:MAG: imelysin family protein [Gammaproteobacteria bacterium]|nr:imelysin family protein [Gammaproteobacteria bacterium]